MVRHHWSPTKLWAISSQHIWPNMCMQMFTIVVWCFASLQNSVWNTVCIRKGIAQGYPHAGAGRCLVEWALGNLWLVQMKTNAFIQFTVSVSMYVKCSSGQTTVRDEFWWHPEARFPSCILGIFHCSAVLLEGKLSIWDGRKVLKAHLWKQFLFWMVLGNN